METILLKYFTTGNLIIDSILMYFFIEYVSRIRIKNFKNILMFLNFNYLKSFYIKQKYKTITLIKKRIRVINKFRIDNKYETTKEIDSVIHYISKNTRVNHYNFSKENYINDDELTSNKNQISEGYLEPSESEYNIILKPFEYNKNK